MKNGEKAYTKMKKYVNITNITVVLLLLLSFTIFLFNNRNNHLNDKIERQIKLNEALKDSVQLFQTNNGELVAEKRSLQGDIKDLLNKNTGLSKEQKDLLLTVNRLNKEWKKDREIFAAATIKYKSLIDSLNTLIVGATDIDTLNNKVSFVEKDTSTHFIYNIDILNVRPNPLNYIPKIKFNGLDFPNTQTITFNWDINDRKDYPVSFTVLNTNKYYKVYNIESFAIPELNKNIIDPNGWQKTWRWIKVNGKYILVGSAGILIGVGISN
jgi:hypothetical protein